MKTCLYIGLFLLGSLTNAQSVSNPEFQKMLDTLLDHTVPEITVADAISKQSEFIFLDARAVNEYNVSHIQNAYWVGYDEFDFAKLKGFNIPSTQKMIVYCSVGYRSEKITEKIRKYGYKNVYNLIGGIFEWKNQGNPVYNNKGKATEKVHAYSQDWGQWLTKGTKVF